MISTIKISESAFPTQKEKLYEVTGNMFYNVYQRIFFDL